MVDKQQSKHANAELVEKVEQALAVVRKTGERVTFAALAQTVGVARSTLHRDPAARQLILSAKLEQATADSESVIACSRHSQIMRVLEEIKQQLAILVAGGSEHTETSARLGELDEEGEDFFKRN